MPRSRSPRRRPEKTTTSNKLASKTRRFRWPLVLATLGILIVGGTTYAALRLPWLTVSDVQVEGAYSLDPASIAQMSGLQGKSMLRLPLSTVRSDLLAIPQIKSVTFSRHWPTTVVVHIDERQPWGFWSVGGRDYPVDIDGVVLDGGAPSSASVRIVEAGDRIMGPGDRVDPDAIALADRIFRESPQFLGKSVQEVRYQAGIGLTVVFSGGLQATFGDDRSYDYKVAVLTTLLGRLKNQGITPHAVDLRFGERVTYN